MESIKTNHGLVHVCSDKTELGKASADEFVKAAEKAIKSHGRFTVGLSGGHTPPLLYDQLTSAQYKTKVEWQKVHFFMSDERCVPVDSKESNWGTAERLLFSKLNIPAENLHPMHGQEENPTKCAEEYEAAIKAFFEVKEGEIPRFDLIQMGMGPDGHTASLFPGTKALKEQSQLVVENFVDKMETHRITFTYPLLNHASEIMFMVEGGEKSHVFAEAVQKEDRRYPVQGIAPTDGAVVWYVDKDTARDLLLQKAK
ncbi:MAG TPA: 6-phosphogluconolactonase [Candidatus Obscuribacterales bacterium]